MKKINYFEEIITLLFILLFTYTAASKLIERQTFAAVLSVSPLIGNKATFISYAIPVTEILIVCLLLFPKTRLKGFMAASILMAIFTLYIIYMIMFTPQLPCSCGGAIKNLSWNQHLVFNFTFTGLAIAGYLLNKRTELFTAVNRLSRTPV